MTIQVSTVSDGTATNGKGKSDQSAYLQQLLNLRPELKPQHAEWLQQIRDRATAQVQKLSFPTTRNEEWRFTDLSSLLNIELQSVQEQSAISLSDIQTFILPEAENSRLVFVNGIYTPALSATEGLSDGVVVTNLLHKDYDSLGDEGDRLDMLPSFLAKLPGAEEVFTSLNTASFTDSAVVWVCRNQSVEPPIHLLFIFTAQAASVFHPRVLVMAEDGSKVTLIEEFVTLNESVYFTNSVTEIGLWQNAEVHHTRIQRDSKQAFHIGKTSVGQARDSRYTCNAISYGAKLSRHNLEVYQTGEQTETTLNGLTMIRDEQVADTHSLISFTKPHGTSHQIHKCIVDDRAHAVFNGKILVPKPAQLTDAGQLSSTLLLSEKARIDTKPQLEITADNVKCAHGATVSQLDSDEVFYLQSRGIDAESARRLLTYAFAYDVLKEIPVPSLRDTLAQYVRNHF